MVLVLISRMPTTPTSTSTIRPAANVGRGARIGSGGATRRRGRIGAATSAVSSRFAAVPSIRTSMSPSTRSPGDRPSSLRIPDRRVSDRRASEPRVLDSLPRVPD